MKEHLVGCATSARPEQMMCSRHCAGESLLSHLTNFNKCHYNPMQTDVGETGTLSGRVLGTPK